MQHREINETLTKKNYENLGFCVVLRNSTKTLNNPRALFCSESVRHLYIIDMVIFNFASENNKKISTRCSVPFDMLNLALIISNHWSRFLTFNILT